MKHIFEYLINMKKIWTAQRSTGNLEQIPNVDEEICIGISTKNNNIGIQAERKDQKKR